MMLIIRASPLSSCGKNLAKPRYDQKDDQFASTVTRLLIFVFTLFFGAFHQADTLELILKNSCWTPLRTKPWPIRKILSNASGPSLSGSVLGCDHQSDILDFLLWNFYLSKLRLIRWPVWKILPHASESSFSAIRIVLTIRTTLWSSHREIVT